MSSNLPSSTFKLVSCGTSRELLIRMTRDLELFIESGLTPREQDTAIVFNEILAQKLELISNPQVEEGIMVIAE